MKYLRLLLVIVLFCYLTGCTQNSVINDNLVIESEIISSEAESSDTAVETKATTAVSETTTEYTTIVPDNVAEDETTSSVAEKAFSNLSKKDTDDIIETITAFYEDNNDDKSNDFYLVDFDFDNFPELLVYSCEGNLSQRSYVYNIKTHTFAGSFYDSYLFDNNGNDSLNRNLLLYTNKNTGDKIYINNPVYVRDSGYRDFTTIEIKLTDNILTTKCFALHTLKTIYQYSTLYGFLFKNDYYWGENCIEKEELRSETYKVSEDEYIEKYTDYFHDYESTYIHNDYLGSLPYDYDEIMIKNDIKEMVMSSSARAETSNIDYENSNYNEDTEIKDDIVWRNKYKLTQYQVEKIAKLYISLPKEQLAITPSHDYAKLIDFTGDDIPELVLRFPALQGNAVPHYCIIDIRYEIPFGEDFLNIISGFDKGEYPWILGYYAGYDKYSPDFGNDIFAVKPSIGNSFQKEDFCYYIDKITNDKVFVSVYNKYLHGYSESESEIQNNIEEIRVLSDTKVLVTELRFTSYYDVQTTNDEAWQFTNGWYTPTNSNGVAEKYLQDDEVSYNNAYSEYFSNLEKISLTEMYFGYSDDFDELCNNIINVLE